MGKKINLVLFWYMNDWGQYGRAYEQIAKCMSRMDGVRRVLCILEPAGGSRLRPFALRRLSHKLCLLTPNSRFFPDLLDRADVKIRLKRQMAALALKTLLSSLRCSKNDTVLWLFPPHRFIYSLIPLIRHRLLITQYVDNNVFLSNQEPNTRTFTERQYEELAKKSDLVITSSELNFSLFTAINPVCYLFENAVDEMFIASPSELPSTVTKARPRIGYVGFISERTDIELLDYVARVRPEYDLVIAGPQEKDLNKYGTLDLPNVTHAGVMAYDDVPGFLQSIDVCLIPHKDTSFSRSMSPLKVFQYLGAGRPIVSTAIAGVNRWSGLISVAGDHHDFVSKIDEALLHENGESSRRRIEAVKGETWQKRCEEMFAAVMKHFDGKRSNAPSAGIAAL